MSTLLKPKLIRTSTVPVSLDFLLKGQLRYLQQYFEVVAVSGPGANLDNVAEREGVATRAISMHRSIHLTGDLVSFWKLYRLFKREKPAIIHSITPKAGLLSMIAGKLARVPVRIHTFTGLIFPSRTGLMYHLLKNMDRLTCAFATKIIPEGEGVKRDLIEHRVTRKPLQVIGNGNVNGIDSTYFSPDAVSLEMREETKHKLGIANSDFVFIFIGRLVKDKGINELVQAFLVVNRQHANAKLLLVGNYEQELDPLAPETLQQINSHPAIISTGFQSDVRPYLAVAHALAFPSYREGFPNVPMQAGAMGLPAIVTNINGCNEIVTDGLNGIIIPPKNTEALESAMIRLVQDRALAQQLASNARESIVSRFEQQRVWELIKAEYDRQLEGVGK